MATDWWFTAGLIHISLLNLLKQPQLKKYCQEIDQLYQKLQSMCPVLVKRKGPILLHDKCSATCTLEELNELGYKTLPHPPDSPDLSPTDYHFLKQFLTRKIFQLFNCLSKMLSKILLHFKLLTSLRVA